MTAEQFVDGFYSHYYPHQPQYIRQGQALMHYLAANRLDLYNILTGDENDCFYDDKIIGKTINYLFKNWNNES